MKIKTIDRKQFKEIDAPISIRATGDGYRYPVKEVWERGELVVYELDELYRAADWSASEIISDVS